MPGAALSKSKLKSKMTKKVKMPDFQFSFSPIYKKFVRELRDEESKLIFDLNLDGETLMDMAYKHV